MLRFPASALLAVAVTCAWTPPAYAQTDAARPAPPPAFEEVLRRARTYIVEYEHSLSGLIGEEHYVQTVIDAKGVVKAERSLKSDYLVFQLPPEESWFAFRDVFEVDGEPVRKREERLLRLITELTGSAAVERAMRLDEESSRHNLGDVFRTINLPTFALAFLRPVNRERLTFEKEGEDNILGEPVWVIRYQETKGPGFVHTVQDRSLRVQGRYWVTPSTGRLLRSEIVVGGTRASRDRGRITVDYGENAAIGEWTPTEMRETYDRPSRAAADVVKGRATYANFRRVPRK